MHSALPHRVHQIVLEDRVSPGYLCILVTASPSQPPAYVPDLEIPRGLGLSYL